MKKEPKNFGLLFMKGVNLVAAKARLAYLTNSEVGNQPDICLETEQL